MDPLLFPPFPISLHSLFCIPTPQLLLHSASLVMHFHTTPCTSPCLLFWETSPEGTQVARITGAVPCIKESAALHNDKNIRKQDSRSLALCSGVVANPIRYPAFELCKWITVGYKPSFDHCLACCFLFLLRLSASALVYFL